MWRKNYQRSGGIVSILFFVFTLHAQYTVTGWNGLPLLALDDAPNRLQVYLVHGMEGVKIQYASASRSHQWYRYKTKAIEAEALTAVQEGTV